MAQIDDMTFTGRLESGNRIKGTLSGRPGYITGTLHTDTHTTSRLYTVRSGVDGALSSEVVFVGRLWGRE